MKLKDKEKKPILYPRPLSVAETKKVKEVKGIETRISSIPFTRKRFADKAFGK